MLIVSPKTHSKTVKQFIDFFDAKQSDVSFWHSNFRDYHFVAHAGQNKDVPVHLLFCGYGEGTMTHAITHAYEKFLRKEDAYPGVIYLGACFASSFSDAHTGDIVVPNAAHSDSEIVREIYEKIQARDENFDPTLSNLLKNSAEELRIKTIPGKIFCKETYEEDFWFPFAKDWGPKQGYVAGEVESAACLAACKMLGLPCAGILEIKDKIDADGTYICAKDDTRREAFANVLKILEKALGKVEIAKG